MMKSSPQKDAALFGAMQTGLGGALLVGGAVYMCVSWKVFFSLYNSVYKPALNKPLEIWVYGCSYHCHAGRGDSCHGDFTCVRVCALGS